MTIVSALSSSLSEHHPSPPSCQHHINIAFVIAALQPVNSYSHGCRCLCRHRGSNGPLSRSHRSLRATRSVGLRPFRVASRGHTLYNGHPVLQLAQMRGLPASRRPGSARCNAPPGRDLHPQTPMLLKHYAWWVILTPEASEAAEILRLLNDFCTRGSRSSPNPTPGGSISHRKLPQP